MRITLEDVKAKKKILILSVLCILIIFSSGVAAYKLMSRGEEKAYQPVTAVHQASEVPEQTNATSEPEITDAKPSEKSFTEKDPFKAEFLERFLKSQREKFADKTFANSPLKVELPRIVLPKDLPEIDPPVSRQVRKPAPEIKILGIYKIGDSAVAITDKGEIREGMFVEDHRVLSVTREKIQLEGVDIPYFITGSK
ncbi:MAG: hypothetical protein IBX72_13400 [Nitrospirae bacterium]|nr:hypothetical protein [Nitrospirota bacterium]